MLLLDPARAWYVPVLMQPQRPTTWIVDAQEGAKTYWGESCVRVGMPLRKRWQVEVEYVLRGGRPVVAELHIYAPPPTHQALQMSDLKCAGSPDAQDMLGKDVGLPRNGLTGTDLRELHLTGRLRRDVVEAWQALAEQEIPLFAMPPPAPRKVRGGQRGRRLPDDVYARLSIDFIEARRTNRRDYEVAMAEAARSRGEKGVTVARLRDRLKLARRYGWLPPAGKQGVPGPAEPGPKLREWLEREGQGRGKAKPTIRQVKSASKRKLKQQRPKGTKRR